MEKYDVVVGDTVHWFVRGNTDAPPRAGIVMDVNPSGMLTLLVLEDTIQRIQRNVHPHGSAQCERTPKIAQQCGTWKYKRPVETPIQQDQDRVPDVTTPAEVKAEKKPLPPKKAEATVS